MTMEAILKSVPSEYITTPGAKDSAKEAWESLKTMRLGGDRVRKAKAQQLRREYEAIVFRNGGAVEDFALQLTSLTSAGAGGGHHRRGGGGGEVPARCATPVRAYRALD